MKIWQFVLWLLAVIFSCMAGYELGQQAVYDKVFRCETSFYPIIPAPDRTELFACIMDLPIKK